MTEPLEQALRDALVSGSGDALDRASVDSIMSAISGDEHLMAIAEEVLGPNRAELELHLAGAGVTANETTALHFGHLVSRTADAVKEIAKSVGGRQRMPSRLQVLAPMPGSVRLVLIAPQGHAAPGVLPGSQAETLESLAMRRFAQMLAFAEEDVVDNTYDSPLAATIQRLPWHARRSVGLVGKTVLEGGWSIDGSMRQKGHESTTVTITPSGAHRLVEVAGNIDMETGTERVQGAVDGWVWSTATMMFRPDEGRPFRASVVNEAIQARVAELNATADQHVAAVFDVVTSYPPGDSVSARKSYVLTDIDALPTQPGLA